ncbi:MAG: CYTH domain-containing protein [Candidatus Nanoarchaeia archaeon]|jgi:predicted adenylyl cyclase CyaB
MVYEVEIRSFISKDKYLELTNFFDKHAVFLSESDQETHYFDCNKDLRIQKNSNYSKIWFKAGKMHDEKRKEIELMLKKEDFSKAQELFNELGFNVKIKWLRKRREYKWGEFSVCIDYTKGYGYIIEIEKLCEEKDKDYYENVIRSKFDEINVKITSKEEFSQKFKDYEKNWKALIN